MMAFSLAAAQGGDPNLMIEKHSSIRIATKRAKKTIEARDLGPGAPRVCPWLLPPCAATQ